MADLGEGPAAQRYKKMKAVDRAQKASARAKKAAEGARKAAGPKPAEPRGIIARLQAAKRARAKY